MVPALKSRAKLTRSLPRPGKRWLRYLFKDHKSLLRGRFSEEVMTMRPQKKLAASEEPNRLDQIYYVAAKIFCDGPAGSPRHRAGAGHRRRRTAAARDPSQSRPADHRRERPRRLQPAHGAQ